METRERRCRQTLKSGLVLRLGRACEKERTRGSAVFQAEHDSTQRTGTAPHSAVCLLPHYLGITNYSGAASACLTHSQSRV